MKNEVIKVLIADDHDIIRQGLKRIISFEEDMEIAAEAENGGEVLKLIEQCDIDVILLDFNMPVMNGIDTLENIKQKSNKIKVIMLTVESDRKTIHKAINIGADGYMLKDSAGTEIVNAIRIVNSGEKYIDKLLVSTLFTDIKSTDNEKNNVLDNLSKREIDVLLKLSMGYSNKEIGQQLYLSEKTIKNYVTSVFRKLNVKDRVQATIAAIQNNIEEYYKNKYKS